MIDNWEIQKITSYEKITECWTNLSDEFIPNLKSSEKDFYDLMDKVSRNGITFSCCNHCTLLGGISFYANDHISKTAFITLLATSPLSRGVGVGHALLTKAIKESFDNKMTAVRLDVRKDNEVAIMFYKSHGFKLVGETDDFFLLKINIGNLELSRE